MDKASVETGRGYGRRAKVRSSVSAQIIKHMLLTREGLRKEEKQESKERIFISSLDIVEIAKANMRRTTSSRASRKGFVRVERKVVSIMTLTIDDEEQKERIQSRYAITRDPCDYMRVVSFAPTICVHAAAAAAAADQIR